MPMNEALLLALAVSAGAVLGTIFFGGLWWTVRNGASSEQPVFWFFGSLLLRMSIVLAGFYFVSDGRWERLLLCLVGFVLARLVVTWLTRSPGDNPRIPGQETRYAP
jgi:F1F0 ATPase subunit 2